MANKFLNNGGTNINLSNGSATIFGASLGALDLDPSQPVRTSATRQLVSGKLAISDIIGLPEELKSTIPNPIDEDLDMNGYRILKNGSADYQRVASKPSPPAGSLRVYANIDGKIHQVDESGTDLVIGSDYDQSLNKDDLVEFKEVAVSRNGTDGVRFRTDYGGATNSLICENYIGGVKNQIFGGNSQLFGIQSQITIMGVNGGVFIKNLTVGDFLGGTNWTLPNLRGTANQVLKTDGLGNTSWATETAGNPFDQSLNSVDWVDFKATTIDLNWDIKQVGGHLEFRKDSDLQFFSLRQGGFVHQYGATGSIGVEARACRGTISAPTASLLNDELYEFLCSGYNSANFVRGGEILLEANQNWGVGATGTDFSVAITPQNTTGTQRYLKLSGTGLTLGAGATDYTLPVVRGTRPYSALVDNTPNGGVGWLSLKNAWGQTYFTNNAIETTFTASNTYAPILGNWLVPGVLNSGFTALSGVLTYDQPEARVFKVDCSGSVRSEGKGDETIQVGFFVNESLIDSGQTRFQVASNNTYPACFAVSTLINLNAGDSVKIRAKNLDSTDLAIFVDISLNIVGVGI